MDVKHTLYDFTSVQTHCTRTPLQCTVLWWIMCVSAHAHMRATLYCHHLAMQKPFEHPNALQRYVTENNSCLPLVVARRWSTKSLRRGFPFHSLAHLTLWKYIIPEQIHQTDVRFPSCSSRGADRGEGGGGGGCRVTCEPFWGLTLTHM